MPAYIALLRAVNVGGTGKLPMTELKALCEEAGFDRVKTYIASGNVVFTSRLGEATVRKKLADALEAHVGKPVGVIVRTPDEMKAVLDGDPFPDGQRNLVFAIFLDEAPPPDAIEKATGFADEQLALGKREIYAWYPGGAGSTKLRIPAAKTGTARNMNTVAKLAGMAAALSA